MIENYAVVNKTDNLIPIVNTKLKGKNGIEAALLYRMNSCTEIDSSILVREAYEQFYNAPIPESADTIFNAFLPFMDFCRSKMIRNMDLYRIRDMYKLEPPYPISEYYGYDDSKLQELIYFVKSAIELIEKRFKG